MEHILHTVISKPGIPQSTILGPLLFIIYIHLSTILFKTYLIVYKIAYMLFIYLLLCRTQSEYNTQMHLFYYAANNNDLIILCLLMTVHCIV